MSRREARSVLAPLPELVPVASVPCGHLCVGGDGNELERFPRDQATEEGVQQGLCSPRENDHCPGVWAVSAHKTGAGGRRTWHLWPCSSGTVHRKGQENKLKLQLVAQAVPGGSVPASPKAAACNHPKSI